MEYRHVPGPRAARVIFNPQLVKPKICPRPPCEQRPRGDIHPRSTRAVCRHRCWLVPKTGRAVGPPPQRSNPHQTVLLQCIVGTTLMFAVLSYEICRVHHLGIVPSSALEIVAIVACQHRVSTTGHVHHKSRKPLVIIVMFTEHWTCLPFCHCKVYFLHV